jgi:hypothetical protein
MSDTQCSCNCDSYDVALAVVVVLLIVVDALSCVVLRGQNPLLQAPAQLECCAGALSSSHPPTPPHTHRHTQTCTHTLTHIYTHTRYEGEVEGHAKACVRLMPYRSWLCGVCSTKATMALT